MKRLLYFYWLLLVFLPASAKRKYKNAVRPEIDNIATAIAQNSYVTGKHICEDGHFSSQWAQYEQLYRQATRKELILLTDHQSPAVRVYAFTALVHRKARPACLFQIIQHHMYDTATVDIQTGCITRARFVADVLLDMATTETSFTSEYKKQIDSLLIFLPGVTLDMKSALINTLPAVAVYRSRLLQMLQDEAYYEALPAIAAYHNPADTSLIQFYYKYPHTLPYAIAATARFPHISFYPYLLKIYQDELIQVIYPDKVLTPLYMALVQYPCLLTYEELKRTTSLGDKYRYQRLNRMLLTALNTYPNPLLCPLSDNIQLSKLN